jgi:hypothetical protein
MSGVNTFLKEFIAMRKALAPTGVAGDMKLIDPGPKNGKGKGKKKATTATELAEDGKMTVAKIVEEKPKARPVLEFLQDRCNELTKAKMAQ